MKKYFAFPFVAIALFFTAFSCDDNNSGNYFFDIATVEVQTDKTFVLRLDDGTRLCPVDLNVYYTPKDRQRVFVNFTILSEKENSCDYSIRINDIWDILTKSPILLTAENADSIGNDPVKVKSIWIGSDFLNVDFLFNYNGVKPHAINLVKNTLVTPPDDGKIHLEFRHNSYQSPSIQPYEGFVCFDLKSLRVPTADSVQLKIKVKERDREKTFDLVYRYNETAPLRVKSERHIYTISSNEYY